MTIDANEGAQLAAIQGGMGEVVEVVAWLHQQGNYTEAAERPLLEDEKSRGWVEHELMTVAQHRRILAQHRQQAGKLVEALEEIASGHGEQAAVAAKALADWEKTNG